jgi:hypothetical protein
MSRFSSFKMFFFVELKWSADLHFFEIAFILNVVSKNIFLFEFIFVVFNQVLFHFPVIILLVDLDFCLI